MSPILLNKTYELYKALDAFIDTAYISLEANDNDELLRNRLIKAEELRKDLCY